MNLFIKIIRISLINFYIFIKIMYKFLKIFEKFILYFLIIFDKNYFDF